MYDISAFHRSVRRCLLTALLLMPLGVTAREDAADVDAEEQRVHDEAAMQEDPEVARRVEGELEMELEAEEQRVHDEAAMQEDPEVARRVEGELATEPDAEEQRVHDEAAMQEDAEVARRVEGELAADERRQPLQLNASVRLHTIQGSDLETGEEITALGDGGSRAGIRAEYSLSQNWDVYGRAELGFNFLEQFSPKSQSDTSSDFTTRLAYVGIESDDYSISFGKDWSAYYRVAGLADQFSSFGGEAAGVYNAGTDGGAFGSGRASDAVRARIYLDWQHFLKLKPFNLNLQFQRDQEIPKVPGRHYGNAFGASAWLETENDFGFGLAYHGATVEQLGDPAIVAAGIDGNARAFAIGFKSIDTDWYASLVLSRLNNVETTDQNKYFNGNGIEFYAQRRFHQRWWFVYGANWLEPDDSDPEAGEYRLRYAVLGVRFTFDSFHRMIHAEYKISDSRNAAGEPADDEFTIGIRWDFGR